VVALPRLHETNLTPADTQTSLNSVRMQASIFRFKFGMACGHITMLFAHLEAGVGGGGRERDHVCAGQHALGESMAPNDGTVGQEIILELHVDGLQQHMSMSVRASAPAVQCVHQTCLQAQTSSFWDAPTCRIHSPYTELFVCSRGAFEPFDRPGTTSLVESLNTTYIWLQGLSNGSWMLVITCCE
jgi:hypothetical protein